VGLIAGFLVARAIVPKILGGALRGQLNRVVRPTSPLRQQAPQLFSQTQGFKNI